MSETKKNAAAPEAAEKKGLVRLQKIMASAGVGSRRACEELIADGRVRVNGEIIVKMGQSYDPSRAVVEVDGQPLQKEPIAWHLLNKPPGVVSTSDDDRGRKTVYDLVRHCPERLFPVGRLDLDTSGLLIMTNDGPYTQEVLHPSKKVFKRYEAIVEGKISEKSLEALRAGVILPQEERATLPCKACRLEAGKRPLDWGREDAERFVQTARGPWSLVEIWIRAGRKRQVKRMLKEAGHETLFLHRTQVGRLVLGDLKCGEMRRLTREEANLAKMNPKGFEA